MKVKSVTALCKAGALALLLSGCAGFVGGDLKNTRGVYLPGMAQCSSGDYRYRLTVKSSVAEDGSYSDPAQFVAGWTLGLIPLYWLSFENSLVEVVDTQPSDPTKADEPTLAFSHDYSVRVHKYYGIIWPMVLNTNGVNALKADTGFGIRVAPGVNARAVGKALSELPNDLPRDQLCYDSGKRSRFK
ncbi:hypothetical protein [Vreelandella sp. TE19]